MAGIYQRELPTAPVFTPSRQYQNVDFGVNSLLKAGSILGEALGSMKDKELADNKIKVAQELLERDRARFSREQELNNRVDTEYNREIGLRDMRKDLAAQYEANPYADIWGGGAANKGLDKQVLDYVNGGGEINADMAGRLQSEYEKNRPFKEDLSQVFRSKLLAAGEDPTKADAYAKSMTDNMSFSRATQQAQLDKQQEIQQGYYNAVAAANKDTAKMGFDIAKANQKASIDNAKLDLDYKKLMYGDSGGGSGKGGNTGGGYTGITELLGDIGPFDAKDALNKIETLHGKGYSYEQLYSALKPSINKDATALLISDQKLNEEALNDRLARFTPGANQFTNTSKVNDIVSTVGAKDLLAQFVPRQIADYNPQGVLERAKTVVPELFGKEVSNSLPSNGVVKDVPSSEIKKLVVDKYGDSNFNKSTYDKNLSEVESGGNYNAYNATSKAFGKYQFVPSTINSLIKQDGSKHTIDEVRKSPELQDYYYDKLTKENIGTLKSSGVPINNFTVYMAHNLGPSQTENFFSNEPLTEATKKAIQAQGVAPTREAYTSRFMHKFENTATPEEKRPTVQKEDISRMTGAERKAYADKLFPDYATEGPVKELFSKVGMLKKAETVKEVDSPAVQKRVLESLNETGGGLLDELMLKRRLVTQDGLTDDEADKAIVVGKNQTKNISDTSNYNVLRRNYLTALREGTYQGKTAKEWEKEFFKTKYLN